MKNCIEKYKWKKEICIFFIKEWNRIYWK